MDTSHTNYKMLQTLLEQQAHFTFLAVGRVAQFSALLLPLLAVLPWSCCCVWRLAVVFWLAFPCWLMLLHSLSPALSVSFA